MLDSDKLTVKCTPVTSITFGPVLQNNQNIYCNLWSTKLSTHKCYLVVIWFSETFLKTILMTVLV